VEAGLIKNGLTNSSYIRVNNVGLRIYHEKPVLMYYTLKNWIKTGKV
jgi:hypothetical protein